MSATSSATISKTKLPPSPPITTKNGMSDPARCGRMGAVGDVWAAGESFIVGKVTRSVGEGERERVVVEVFNLPVQVSNPISSVLRFRDRSRLHRQVENLPHTLADASGYLGLSSTHWNPSLLNRSFEAS